MKARYSMRVLQGNNYGHQVPVTVIAGNECEARRKALALTDVHSPVVVVDSVEEVDPAPTTDADGRDERRDGVGGLAEAGRRLASEREDLIASGVDPADLEVPLRPDERTRWDQS